MAIFSKKCRVLISVSGIALYGLFFSTSCWSQAKAEVQKSNYRYQSSFVRWTGSKLVIGTGKITRTWKWTGKGLNTISLVNEQTSKEWCQLKSELPADWTLPGAEELANGKVTCFSAKPGNDDHFTSDHLEVSIEINYPLLKTTVVYLVWAYPGAKGIRTQLKIRSDTTFNQLQNNQLQASTLQVVRASSAFDEHTAPENAADGNVKTIWRSKITNLPPDTLNYLVLDLGTSKNIQAVGLTQVQDYHVLGYVNRCVVFASDDTTSWGNAIGAGELSRSEYEQHVTVASKQARYAKIVFPATSPVNRHEWQSSLAEVKIYSDPFFPARIQNARVDFLPIRVAGYQFYGIGYYADTQWRASLDLPFIREETAGGEAAQVKDWSWNNSLFVQDKKEGLCLVKESHKTVIQRGHYTGEFILDNHGVFSTGWGLSPEEIRADYRNGWAGWVLVYEGDQPAERQQAIKHFDRKRFPAVLPGHRSVFACSWGYGNRPGATGREKRDGALERNVLEELDAAADCGVEAYLIDDGWQIDEKATTFTPNAGIGWKPHPDNYANGWEKVVKHSTALGIKLALWAPVQSISSKDLNFNQQQGHFISWKFDFAVLNSLETRYEVERKARDFISSNNYQLSIQWDLTENYPRYGFYWGREYGVVWLENKEPNRHILYTPSVTLRDAWELSKYVNINKFQLPVRNTDSIVPPSDASLHDITYGVAIAMAGIPVFFEKMQSFSPTRRKEINTTLSLYKNIREQWMDSFIYPIGNRPDNASFTGFQAIHPDKQSGYLLLFRELYASEQSAGFKLHFIKHSRVKLTNLRTGESEIVYISRDGTFITSIKAPADWVCYHYQIIS